MFDLRYSEMQASIQKRKRLQIFQNMKKSRKRKMRDKKGKKNKNKRQRA